MASKEALEKELEQIQRKLDKYAEMPADNFNVGTLLFFQTSRFNWILEKMEDSLWQKTNARVGGKTLHEWFLETEESGVGDFIVAELRPKNPPFFEYATPL